MGLDEFITESKGASPKNSVGPSSGGVDEFINDSNSDSVDIAGGFTLDKIDNTGDTEVIKIFGGPGTGKTTTMVGNTDIQDFQGILHKLFEEQDPNELMLIAYTRAAADEVKNRLSQLTSVSENRLSDRITTIHSLAMGMNSLTPKDIVEIRWSNDKLDFCKDVGLYYNTNANSDKDEMLAQPEDEGHLFFDMNSWLKSSLKPAKEVEDCPLYSNWEYSVDEFVEFSKGWEQYKKSNGIWEFDDAIMECVNQDRKIDAKYLFVDEVQDLYPLQQAFLDNQFGHVDRIFLAGDDDQTIYEWAGAAPEYFLDMEGNVNEEMPELWQDKTGYWQDEGVYILDQSWRMPSDILELSKKCIRQVSKRQAKNIKPHHEGGEFIPLQRPNLNTILTYVNPDDTYVLFRAKYQIDNFAEQLIEAGIPYEDMRFKNTNYGGNWNPDTIKLRDGLAAIKNHHDEMSGEQASRVIEEMPTNAIQGNRDDICSKFGSHTQIPTEVVTDAISYGTPKNDRDFQKYLMDFEELNWYQENAVKYNLLEDNEHMVPDGFRLSTIHGSKGREADTVILSTSSTQSVMENMPEGEINDAERRLYYVGMTRTENRLVMVEDMDPDSPTLTIDQLIGSEWRDQYGWQNSSAEDVQSPEF